MLKDFESVGTELLYIRSLPLFLIHKNDIRDCIITRLTAIMRKGARARRVCTRLCGNFFWNAGHNYAALDAKYYLCKPVNYYQQLLHGLPSRCMDPSKNDTGLA